jgi:ribosomal protein S18 acetylase RimI-like enzyme
MQVIKAEQMHVDAIVEIWKDFMDYHKDLNPIFARSNAGHETFKEFLQQEIENEDSFAAVSVENEEVIGYILAKKSGRPPCFEKTDFCFITDIMIKEQYRKKGYGKKLIDAVTKWAKEKGLDRIELQVVPSNDLAYAFYHKLGFTDMLHTLYLTIN